MNEYKGKGAEAFAVVPGNKYILFPAILRTIGKARSGSKLLDIGCGNGAGYELTKNLGYKYFGFDSSEDMVKVAKKRFPSGDFRVASASTFASLYKDKFNVIMSSMVFPCFSTKEEMTSVLLESSKALVDDGKIVIGTSHPNFDAYMRHYLGMMNDRVETDFQGYFKSGQKFLIKHDFGGHEMVFQDYHWTFEDYLDAIVNAGLKLVKIDECPPESNPDNPDYTQEKSKYPTRLVLVAIK